MKVSHLSISIGLVFISGLFASGLLFNHTLPKHSDTLKATRPHVCCQTHLMVSKHDAKKEVYKLAEHSKSFGQRLA